MKQSTNREAKMGNLNKCTDCGRNMQGYSVENGKFYKNCFFCSTRHEISKAFFDNNAQMNQMASFVLATA